MFQSFVCAGRLSVNGWPGQRWHLTGPGVVVLAALPSTNGTPRERPIISQQSSTRTGAFSTKPFRDSSMLLGCLTQMNRRFACQGRR